MAFVPQYILILGFTIVIDYFAGIYLERIEGRSKKVFLVISIIANIGILAVFKYYNFFLGNLDNVFQGFGVDVHLPYLNILLPIGLSFHTFQAMSYTIEVYRGNQKAEKHFGIYALYVMFYPQLVAGPIERPQNVLHQFHAHLPYNKNNLKEGLLQMAWGFFKKIVIADRLAMVVDYSYQNHEQMNGTTMLLATLCYSFQIYCDFSGYSDIGIGAAKVMGFDLMKNFNSPYLSTSISEFWRRWHISLSTWFRDYLYIPLGGNRVNKSRAYLNIFIVFLISGLWHGANWTFIIWGALHGLFLIIENLFSSKQTNTDVALKTRYLNTSLKVIFTFSLITFSWIFFRSSTLSEALAIIHKVTLISVHDTLLLNINHVELLFCATLIIGMIVKEYNYGSFIIKSDRTYVLLISLLIISCYMFGVFGNKQFIYFQF